MIRYAVPDATLEKQIRKYEKRGEDWISRAEADTKSFRNAKAYVPGHATKWSEIKQVFVTAQQGKCIYCERKIGSEPGSAVEWDVEHYRPKSEVAEWKAIKTGPGSETGYYLLALNWRNYLASCKRCNSTHKKSYFPVAKARRLHTEDPAELREEQPHLPFPLGDTAEDPEALLGFAGCVPVPRTANAKDRAAVVIRFFGLDVNEDLIEARATLITSLHLFLEVRKDGDGVKRREAERLIQRTCSDRSEQANCARSFVRLYESDPAEAKRQRDACEVFLASKGS